MVKSGFYTPWIRIQRFPGLGSAHVFSLIFLSSRPYTLNSGPTGLCALPQSALNLPFPLVSKRLLHTHLFLLLLYSLHTLPDSYFRTDSKATTVVSLSKVCGLLLTTIRLLPSFLCQSYLGLSFLPQEFKSSSYIKHSHKCSIMCSEWNVIHWLRNQLFDFSQMFFFLGPTSVLRDSDTLCSLVTEWNISCTCDWSSQWAYWLTGERDPII